MKQNKLQKGDYGFPEIQKKRTILLTILFFAIVLAVFFAGLFTTKSRLNVMTVVAVAGCLPACKQAVNCIMVCRKKTCKKDRYEAISALSQKENLLTAYELYITSPKRAYAFDAACVFGHDVILLSHPGEMNVKECQSFIKEILKNNEEPNCNVKIHEKESSFLEHMKTLAKKKGTEDKETEEETLILRVLLAISV